VKTDLLARTGLARDAGHPLATNWAIIEQLFDQVPDTAFFIKDSRGRYLAVNQSLVERCGMQNKAQLLGRHVAEIFPKKLADLYASQDEAVLKSGRPITDHLELHWYAQQRPGWCLTTKLAMRDGAGGIVGVAGISRDLRAPGESDVIPERLASTLEYLETHYADAVTPGALAKLAGLSPVRFARLIKRIFRITPYQLITQTRLAAAARLLVDSNQSVADIACACGFYDHSALSRAFRSASSLTPSMFRQLAQSPWFSKVQKPKKS
jgi:PAS domain S-box-containing protein